MNPSTDLCFGKTPLTPSHGDSLVDQSFQSLKSKEVRDSESPLREIKFRNSGGVAGGVLVPDTTGWNVQTSSEVSPDGRAFRTETVAKTDGVEKIPGGRAEFAGRNEQKSSASHQGDDKNFVKKAAESSKTHLQENIVVGDENSGRTEMKSSSVTSSSSKVVSSSSQVISSGDPDFDLEPRRLTQDPQYQKVLSAANTSALRNEQQQQYQRNERSERNERKETSSNVQEESKKYVDMDKASPEYQQHVQYLMSQPGAIVSNVVEYPKPGVKMITTVKKLPDGTTVKTKRYETDANVDTGSISQTVKQQQQQKVSSSTTQKSTTEKRIQDSEDVFTRLARTRDNSGPVSPRKTPETPSQEDIYARLQKSRGEQKFSDTIDQRSTQILRDTNQRDNVELISSNKTVKKDLSQSVRNANITSADFIDTERNRYVIDHESPSRRGPDGIPEALVPITPGRFSHPDDTPTNGFTSTGVIQQSSKSSAKFSESRRYSTETVESYQHSESHNESQDTTTHGYPSVRRPIEEPKGRSPSSGRPGQDFSTHGFPSVRSDKPTQEYPSARPANHEEYNTTERVHIVSTERPRPGDSYPDSTTSTTRRHVTSTTDNFSTHGFPSVRAGTPTRDSPKPGDSPRRPSNQEPPANQGRKPTTDSFSTHGFPSVKTGTPTDDSPRRPSGPEPINQGRRPTTDDFSTQGFPSVKPGRTTPTQSAPQYDDSQRTPIRRPPSVDRDDTISVNSDRSNSITYEKRIDAAHQAFARSLRCASPVESIRRDSISDRPTPKTSVSNVRNSYSPSKRDGRSPSHESITNSESSRISSGTVTKSTHTRPITTDIRRVSGPKSPISKTAPSHVSNETIDITLTRKITAKPTDNKPAAGRPSTVKDKSESTEPILRKKVFATTEDFLASEVLAQEPILKKEQYYQLGPSDATLPSSRLKTRQVLGTTPNTSRRPTTYNTAEEVNTHNTIPTRSAKTQLDTKSNKPDTLYSSKPKTKPEGYVSLNRANEITEKHNQTTNKQVSYPHYIPSAPKADRSSTHSERPQTSSDRPTKNLSSPAPTTSTTTPHNAPKFATDKPKPKIAPSNSPTTKPSSSPTKVDNSTPRFTKTVKVDNAITRDTTKTRREPQPELLAEPEDIDEGYVPDRKGQRRPKSDRPTSDDEGFEPESPRAGSPTSDFEYRRPTQTETYDEEDSIFKRTRKTDKKVVTDDFLDTERGVKQPRRPEDRGRKSPYLIDQPSQPTGTEPKRPNDGEPRKPSGPRETQRPEDRKPSHLTEQKPYGPSGPRQSGPSRPEEIQPRRPEDRDLKPSYLTDEEPNGPSGPSQNHPRRPEDNEPRGPTDKGVNGPKRPEDERTGPSDLTKPRGSKPPLDRSETFDERCRHILGMENETTIERAKRVQDFIDTERVTVDIKRQPAGRSPSPQKKQPIDTVSIEDCDDDDDGVPRRYPAERTTTTTKTTNTTKGEYPRDRSTNEKPIGRGDQPRDRYPLDKIPRQSEVDETTITTTTKSTRPRDGSPLSKTPKGTEIDDTTLRRTTVKDTTIVHDIDDHLTSTRPKDGSPTRPREGSPRERSPLGKRPTDENLITTTTTRDTTYGVDRPRGKSPSKQPVRGRSPTEETIMSRTTTTTRDTTVTDNIDDRYPSSGPKVLPRDQVETNRITKDTTTQETIDDVFEPSRPRDQPRGVRPTDDTTVKRTTTSTRDTTIIDDVDDRSPSSRPRDYPRDRSPTEKPRGYSPTDDTTVKRTTTSTRDTTVVGEVRNYPRDRSPSEKPRGRTPTDDTTVKRTTTTRDTTIIDDVDDHSPSSRPRDYPRDRSPTEKPRGYSPTDDTTVKRTTTSTRDTTIIDDDRSPSSRPGDYPRDRSPTEKPRGYSPTDDTTVKRTTTSTRDTTVVGEVRNYPRDRSPSEKPRGRTPTDDTTVKRTTTTRDTTISDDVDDHSPSSRPRDYPRDRSPTEKPRGYSPTDDTTVKRTTTSTRDTTVVGEVRNYPRDRSPSEKPRGRSPTDDTTVKRTTTTRDTTIIGEIDDRSPSSRPRDYPRDRSPTEKPRGYSPTDDTTVKRTTTSTRDTTVVGEVRNYPRDRSPSEKPRGRTPTDDTTVRRTTTTRDTTIIDDVDDRSPSSRPRDYPRDRSPTEKPRGRSPTDDTTVKRTTTTRDTTIIGEIDDRSPSSRPRDYPRDRSPTEKPRGRSPTDDVKTVKRTTTTTRDTTSINKIDDRSSPSHPRDRSPSEKPYRGPRPTDVNEITTETVIKSNEIIRPRSSPRDRSPAEKPIRSPRIITTAVTTEYGIENRPQSQSPKDSEKYPRGSKPNDKETTSRDRSPIGKQPRGSSPGEKPRRRQPTGEDTEETVVQRTTKTTRDRKTLEEIDLEDRPRDKSPSQKPRTRQPSEEETDETLVETIIEKTTGKTTSPKDRPRGTSPLENPRRRQPTDEEIEETTVQKTVKTTSGRTTLEKITDRSPKDRPRGTSPTEKPSSRGISPTEKPRGTKPTSETVIQKNTKTTTNRTTVDDRSSKSRPRGTSPTDKPSLRGTSPTEKPRGPRPTGETVIQKITKITTDRTTEDDRSPEDRLRGTSPTDKPRRRQPTDEEIDVTVVQKTTKTTRDRTTLEETSDRSPKDRYPEDHPRDRSPTEKPRGRRPSNETIVQRTIKATTIEDHTSKSPRGTSPSEKPRNRSPTDRSPKGPREISPSEKPSAKGYPRDRSPTEKPRGPRPTSETNVQRIVKTTTTDRTTTDDRSPKDRPRGTSPTEKPKRRQPSDIEKTVIKRISTTTKDKRTLEETDVEDLAPKDRPRGTSPTQKPRRRRPSDEETDEELIETTIETTTIEEDSPIDRPRGTSPRRRHPTEEEIVTQRTSKITRDRKTVEEVDVEDRSSKYHLREKSPSEKPSTRDRSPTEKARGPRPTGVTILQTTVKTTIDRPRGISPSEKPTRRQPTDEEIVIQRTSKTIKDRTTVNEIDVEDRYREDRPRSRSPTEKPRGPSTDGRPRGASPSEKPKRRQPTDEDIQVNIVQRTTKTTLEEIEDRSPKERPRGHSPSEKPYPRSSPRATTPFEKPQRPTNGETDRYPVDRPRDRSPSEKPKGSDETIIHRTVKATTIRGTSPSDKPRRYLPSDEETDETFVRSTTKTTTDRTTLRDVDNRPRGRSPSDLSPADKPRRSRPNEVDETTVRSATTRTTLKETDFEKRYPKGRPTDQSPIDKPFTRRPSKPSTITTTTTRNRSNLEEQDLTRTTRPKTQPTTRDKVPTKTTTSTPRSQTTTERRIPAELPSPVRKPKSTLGTTTTTTTQTSTTRVPATRPKTTKEVPKKPIKPVTGPGDSRPGARQPERKHSPSISPDSSPSRPTSEVDLESPHRSPNTSPSRKSPSPTRSVKLEDITSSVVTTKKTTVSIDKSQPKVTHITTAKFQVSPPTSPTKVISAPEIKSSPSRKPITKGPTPKPTGSRLTTDKTTTKKVTTVRRDVVIPTDSERDSEVPTDLEDVDSPISYKTPTRKLPVTERKESAPVHRVTQVDKEVQKMSRSTSENIIKTTINKRPVRHEPLEPITQREATKPTGGKTSPKAERRPSKHLSTKTINLTTFDKVINSQDMENVVIDIQQAKSSREPSPNKIVPTPVSVDLYTGKPRYPDVVQEPEDEPRKKPNVKNIPIFEEETNDFVGCQITEVNEESFVDTTKVRTRKFIDGESRPQRTTPTIVTGDNVDNECLLSVHDKVSKFISTAEEVSKPKTSAPFRRDVPEEEDVPVDDECLLSVDEKVNKFLKTAESVTREVITSTPKPIERPRIDDLDEDLRTDECVLSVSEKVNKFTTKAEKLAPSAPQRSPELVARIERQISRQSDVEPESPRDTQGYPESPDDDDSPTTVRRVKQTKSQFERDEKKYTERQIDILSRPSVWDKKPKVSDVKLDDILGYSPEDEPEPVDSAPKRKNLVKEQPDAAFSKPSKPITDTVSKRKEIFENKTSTKRTTATPKPGSRSPERAPKGPTQSPSRRQPSDESDSRYPSEFKPKYPQEPDDVHEDVYGSLKTRRLHETSTHETTTVHKSPERSPTRKSSHPEIRPTTQTPTRTSKQPEQHSPSPRRYSDDHSPGRYSTRDQPQTDLYMETRETSRKRSSTQKYPEDHSPDRRTPHDNTHSPRRKQPVDEPEDYTFSSRREETNKHHTTRTSYRSPKDTPLNQTSILDDEDHDHSPARSTSTISSQKRTTTHSTTSNRLTEDTSSRRPRRPSGNETSTPTSGGRTPRPKGVPETVAARRNIFEKSPRDVSPRTGHRRPSYMDHTKSSLEHTRRDSLEVTKTNYSRKSSMEDEPFEASPRTAVKFGVGLKHKEEPKPRRKLSSSDIPNIEDVFELDLLEEMLNIVTLYEQRRRIRAQIRVVKKLLETKTKEEVSRMTKITTFRKTSSSSVRDSPIPRRDTPMRPDRYQPSDDIDSESIFESSHIEEREEIIRERSISPQTKTSKTVTKVTEVRKIGEPSTPKRAVPRKDEPKDSKPIWATKNILKKPSENEKVARALSAKKTTSTSSTSTSRTQQTHRQRVAADEDCITSSYGIGPTDEDGRPLFGIRALKKKTTSSSKPSETTKVTGTVITEKYYSENGAEPVGERKVTVYSTNPEDLVDLETQYDRRDSETVKRERLSKDGVTTVTKVQKIGKYKPGEVPAITDDDEFVQTTPKTVRRGSVKEMSEKFIRKESSSSVTEKSSGYPKAGLILRTRTNSGATADAADQYEVRAKSAEYDDESDNDCDVQIRTSRKHSKVVTESEDETEIRRKVNTRSFLNSAGSKVTGVDDVLDRMRNADNVVVDGDTLEDREARALLNKFLGASVLMTGMESIIPQKELKKSTAGADKSKKQEVKTTRVTKTIKSAATGGSSSSPVARETCDFEEIWDEEILKELLEKSTSYEERRSIRARLRQLMAEREACAELVASVKAELDNDKKVKTTSSVDKKVIEEEQQIDDESSCSEYEEIIEEYTASEDEEDKTTVSANADKKIEVVKDDESKTKQIIQEIQKTTITKKEEPKQTETKKIIVVEKSTVIKKDAASSSVDEKKQSDTKKVDDDETSVVSGDNSKGESLLIPLLQGLLHKNMPQARSSSGTSKIATTATTNKANQNSNNLKSSLKSNNTHFSSTSSNNNNSLGDSGLSSEVSKHSSLGQQQGGSSLRVTAQQIEDSGTESGEDLRLIAAGIRDSMQIEGIEDQSDMSLIKEVTNALNRLESSLKEGKDLALDNSKKNTLLALVERLQTGLTAPDKLSSAVGEQDFPDETSSPEADNHRSNRQRFAKRRNRNNRHTVGVSKEELADARRYMEEMVMIENLSSCTTPESHAATTPPQFFAIQKQYSTGAILSNHDPQQSTSSLFRPNQFVPSNLKHSTEAGTVHPEVQLRQKKGNPGNGQRQSTGDMDYMTVANPDASTSKRPLSDSYDTYSAQSNRVTFSDTKDQTEVSVQEKNQYNRSHHTDNQPDVTNRSSPDSSRFNRFNNKKQLMKRANTIDIPKTHRYNPEFDTDSDFEDKSSFNVKGLRGTVQVSVKRKPRQVVPNFEPKTENDHKFLAFIQKQNTTPGLGWNSSKSVSNWTNKFGNIKNVFESGSAATNSSGPKVSASPASSAKNFWKKTDEQAPPKVSTSVLTSALKAKERNEQKMADVVAPKPIHMNKFIHNPQSAFRPIDISPERTYMQFKPIPMERPANVVKNVSPVKAYNPPSSRKQPLESPNYAQSSPTKSWVKKNTATNSPVTLPWAVKPPENSVLRMAATKFESKSPLSAVQRHQSFKQQDKRPSLPNAAQPYQYEYDTYSQPSYMSNSQPASYAEYTQSKVARADSLTNPQAEPLILTPEKPAYSPHSLQPFDYYSVGLSPNLPQTDMTDDDIDDMESMTEYRVEAKVMGKPVSQQAVTIGKRTAHVSDDEVFGKNSRAAKSLLSVMKNIGNGNPEKTSKKVERKIAPSSCMSPDGRAYQAPIVEPLFPEVTKFETNRSPEYIGPQAYQQQLKQQVVDYQKNPAYAPLQDFEYQQPPVAPPRGRKINQEKKKSSPYIPQERPNANHQPRREAPSSLPLQTTPIGTSSYSYNSPNKTPVSSPYTTQIIPDGMYVQNIPPFRQPYSGPNTPDDYTTYQAQAPPQKHYDPTPKGYTGPPPVVNLPQIPLETSYTKVYDQPRDIAPYYQPPATYQNSPNYDNAPSQPIYTPVDNPRPQTQRSPKVQQNSQQSAFEVPQYYESPMIQQNSKPANSDMLSHYNQSPKAQQSQQPQFTTQQSYQPNSEIPSSYYPSPKIQQNPQQTEVPPQYYQSPKVQQSSQQPAFVPQQIEVPPQYYQSPKVQQSPQQPSFAPQQTEIPPQYYQSPKVQQSPQQDEVPPQFYQSPKIQQSPQAPAYAPQQAQVPPQYYQSPKIQQSPQAPTFAPPQPFPPKTDVPASHYQSPKVQQTEVPPQFYQSPKIQQSSQPPSFSTQQAYQSPKAQQSSQPPIFVPKIEAPTQYNQSPKIQQSSQPLSPPYQPKAQQSLVQAPQPKPQVPPKTETMMQSSKSQNTSSTHRQQQSQKTVVQEQSQKTVVQQQSQKTVVQQQSQKTVVQQQSQKAVLPTSPPQKQPIPSNTAVLCKQASLDGRNRVQSQSQLYEKVDEVRRKSLGNILEITRLEREAREQKAAAIKQDMYSVQQDVYSQQVKTAQKTEIHQQQTTVYKSSAPDDTPDIVKSSLAKDDIPILKKFGPPQRHCYIPNAYQNPLTKSETTVAANSSKPAQRKFSEPSVTRGPVIVETPSTPQPDGQDEIPRNIVFNNVSAFTSMSHRYGESSTEYSSQQNRPNKLSKCDSWHQICQSQNATQPPSSKFNNTGSGLRRSKSGHTLALPKLYEAGYDKTQISEKQKTVAAYFSGQKSPNSLSRSSSQTNIAEASTTVSVKKSSINRIKTSQKASTSRQNPSSGLSRSHTMPQIANVNLLDESNVEDAFEQLMNELSTTTTEKTETKKEDGGVVTTTTKVTTRTVTGAPKPVSPFAKFQQLDKQNSLQSPKSPLTPTTPGGSSSTPIFRFTDPALNARAATVKDQLLQWCQSKTQEYENVQITNFSASWTDGLAFCALIHHFLPDAFDYSKLSPKQRRYNFELAFRVADEKAGIAPLLDVEDMVVMRRPDWKCVFTYVQSIHRRFRNCQ